MAAAKQDSEPQVQQPPEKRPVCGLVRPIAAMGDYSAQHWADVERIVSEAVEAAGFRLRLVSEAERVGIILNDIVSNLYNDPIIICDVSGRNANVMFELGMRVAFEKPVVIITDNETPFSFDISPIKHITYPRTLRYGDMQSFKAAIGAAIPATVEAASSARGYLQQFGDIKVADLETQTIGIGDLVNEMRDLRREVRQMRPFAASDLTTPLSRTLAELAAPAPQGRVDLVLDVAGDRVPAFFDYLRGHARAISNPVFPGTQPSRARIVFEGLKTPAPQIVELAKVVDPSAVIWIG